MSFVLREQRLFFVFFLFTIKLIYGKTTVQKFRSSNLELIPNSVILNSTANVEFLCINHQLDELPLMYHLSKNISNNQINIFPNQLNQTTVQIRLELKNYIGIFHLFCYLKDKQMKGTRADVIVKDAPGIIQLVERCRVYDRQYIKCVIRAPNIARAIQNDFPYKFEFIPISDELHYNPNFEFLKNEIDDECLVFKWKPIVDEEFPNGVIMNMKIMLPYFDVSFYRFDMTPVFSIKRNFTLRKESKSEIRILLTPTSPSVLCEKSITPKTNSNMTQTWTTIELDRNIIIINDLLSSTIYRMCIKCRQTDNDPYSIEECQEIETSNIIIIYENGILIIVIIVICFIILFILGFIYYCCRMRRNVIQETNVANEVDHQVSIDDCNQTENLTGPQSDDDIEMSSFSEEKYTSLFRKRSN